MKLLTLLLALVALSSCGKSTTPSDPLHAAAAQTCKNTIEARAVNRKTLDFRSVDVTPAQKGQLNVAIDFTATNEVGVIAIMTANCTVSADGKTLVAINAREKR